MPNTDIAPEGQPLQIPSTPAGGRGDDTVVRLLLCRPGTARPPVATARSAPNAGLPLPAAAWTEKGGGRRLG
ncbi:hypothetical protein KSP40_PGU020769 [Platanthera guangdongensis]|uniref:Uncharacterized protein n=1 Tax=Platanthera guangdongensis TaxID=2320717 RepID=A0ABR2MHB9_9ASPA